MVRLICAIQMLPIFKGAQGIPYIRLVSVYRRISVTLTHLPAEITGPRLVGLELLPDDGEIRFVSCQAKHDQISISSAQDVVGVGVVVGLGPLSSDKVHDLVLSLT